ncbi:hypothetical protein GCM10010470_21870 [Saccharopolyspora taberi]|uniref:Uncharacterized protein n=1 Tax=Saccharopolyspora taberi TaxID=60895 RepID=A0ABN3VAM5_9PSEU
MGGPDPACGHGHSRSLTPEIVHFAGRRGLWPHITFGTTGAALDVLVPATGAEQPRAGTGKRQPRGRFLAVSAQAEPDAVRGPGVG